MTKDNKCVLCGSPGILNFNHFWCINSNCPNYDIRALDTDNMKSNTSEPKGVITPSWYAPYFDDYDDYGD